MKRLSFLLATVLTVLVCTTAANAQSAATCGLWLNGCTQMAHNVYNMCRNGGGDSHECALLGEERLMACIEEIENAGCDEFPSNCYTFDVRQPYAKACQSGGGAEIQTLESIIADTLYAEYPTIEETQSASCLLWLGPRTGFSRCVQPQ